MSEPHRHYGLLDLPAELRLMVYRHILPSTTDWRVILVSRSSDDFPRIEDHTLWRRAIEKIESIGKDSTISTRTPKEGLFRHIIAGARFRRWSGLSTRRYVSDFVGNSEKLKKVINAKRDRSLEEAHKGLIALAKTSRLLRLEVAPILFRMLQLSCQDISVATYFGAVRPFTTSHIQSLELLNPLKFSLQTRKRWITQLLNHYSSLRCLQIHGVHNHKNPAVWGTSYRPDDLRMLKFIVDNSRLKAVVSVLSWCSDHCLAHSSMLLLNETPEEDVLRCTSTVVLLETLRDAQFFIQSWTPFGPFRFFDRTNTSRIVGIDWGKLLPRLLDVDSELGNSLIKPRKINQHSTSMADRRLY